MYLDFRILANKKDCKKERLMCFIQRHGLELHHNPDRALRAELPLSPGPARGGGHARNLPGHPAHPSGRAGRLPAAGDLVASNLVQPH